MKSKREFVDHYAVLGVEKTATKMEVRKSFKMLSFIHHPDKKNGDDTLYKLITDAYDTLMDDDKCAAYHKAWDLYHQERDEVDLRNIKPIRYLTSNRPNLSWQFREAHKKYKARFKAKPSEISNPSLYLKYSEYNTYSDLASGKCHNIFSFVQWKNGNLRAKDSRKVPAQLRSPAEAFLEFHAFLKGLYYGPELDRLIGIFAKKIRSTEAFHERALYQGIHDIFSLSTKEFNLGDDLVMALKNITDFVQYNPTETMPYAALLLQSLYFRHLYFFALHLYWLSPVDVCDASFLNAFNGLEQAQKNYESYVDQLSVSNGPKEMMEVRVAKLFYRYEQEVHSTFKPPFKKEEQIEEGSEATFYRQKAYTIVDWVGALGYIANKRVLANLFLQAGTFFQKASTLERDPVMQMADERLAIKAYLNAVHIAKHATPDISLYIHTHALKFMMHLHYMNDDDKEIIQDMQSATLTICNVFPFFESLMPNFKLSLYESSLVTMRSLLHSLLNIIEANSKADDKSKIALDHDNLSLIYLAYQSNFEGWFTEHHSPAVERKYRHKLMQELLSANRWTSLHIINNLKSPWANVPRDPDGWLDMRRSIVLPDKDQTQFYKSLRGFELNTETGRLEFLYEPLKATDGSYSKLISQFDVHEITHLNPHIAIFSLDPACEDEPYKEMRYLPVNKMRIGPKRMYGSQLSYWMFESDQTMKVMSVGYEPQTKAPFDLRRVDEITKKLPSHLKKIIFDFRVAKSKYDQPMIHRFWIEAPKLDYANKEGDGTFLFGHMKMVVKKHHMAFVNGKLQDIPDSDEGWHIYIQNSAIRPSDLEHYQSPAMIWVNCSSEVYSYEDNFLSGPHLITHYKEHVKRLSPLNRDKHHKIIDTDYDSETIIYNVVKDVCKQIGVEHHYSPEFVFARELTRHYDEFAMYFVEFGRVRELSKALAIVNILDSIRLSNQQTINDLKSKINGSDTEFWSIYKKEIRPGIQADVNSHFATLRSQDITRQGLKRSIHRELSEQYTNLSGWDTTKKEYEIRQRFNAHIAKQGANPYCDQAVRLWNEQWKTVKQDSSDRYHSLLTKLEEVYTNRLISYGYDYRLSLYRDFLNGNLDPLYESLVAEQEQQIERALQNQYPTVETRYLWGALNNEYTSIQYIVDSKFAHAKALQVRHLEEILAKKIKVNTSLTELGLSDDKIDPTLEGICLWVPAAMYHEVNKNHSYSVYGGVSLATSSSRANGQMGGALSQQSNNARVNSATQVQINRANGNAFRDHVANSFRQLGYQVQTEVYKRTPFGGRYMDVQVSKNGTVLGGIETKTGNARYSAQQQAKDAWLGMNSYPVNMVRERK